MSATLTYLGHCAFVWRSGQGRTVLIDPFQNPPEPPDWFMMEFPDTSADAVAVTHDHFDHNGVGALTENPRALRGSEEFTLGDIKVKGVVDLHSGDSGRRGMANTIFVIQMNGVRACHIGDNRPDIPPEVREQIGRVDILMVPVDDSLHLLTFDEVDQIAAQLSPAVIIPMHHYTEGLTTVESTLGGIDGWLATQRIVRRINRSEIVLERVRMPYNREVWVLDAHLAHPTTSE